MNRHNLVKVIGLPLFFIFLIIFPLVIKEAYIIHIFIMLGISIILCSSLRLVVMAGAWNLGQIAFYAIGAYFVTLMMYYFNISFWLLLPLAGILAAIISLGFGYVTIRVKGFYFAMLTMAFVEIIRLTVISVPFLGAQRVIKIPPPDPIVIPNLFTIDFSSKVSYYYLVLVIVIIVVIVLYMIDRSRTGRILKNIGISESLCESAGVATTQYKVLAFMICCFFAGIAGGIYAPYVGLIGPGSFNTTASIMIFLCIVIGGIDSFWGPLIGAVIMTALPEILRTISTYETMVFAVILILIIFFLPRGITSLPEVARHWFRSVKAK